MHCETLLRSCIQVRTPTHIVVNKFSRTVYKLGGASTVSPPHTFFFCSVIDIELPFDRQTPHS